MNLDRLEQQIIEAARRLPPPDHVPYAFEKRVMNRLLTAAPIDPWQIWSALLWRAAAPCVAVTVALSVWTVATHGWNNSVPNSSNLATDLERTVWGPLTALNESW